ncbi:arginine metabolism regulation protein II [[Candida] railenensis]|uniref:Arginine metabolism regulation protein II n=1 Tax=[Candida] railenensis TaxID=45579 RepID=A0A9P0VX76_9ASCO|nr:arginine metabolism regulation protein II [[Candida] railenensis]
MAETPDLEDETKSIAQASTHSNGDGGRSKIKRSKTFTGCYTCRARKIRCDLGKPECQKCIKSQIPCGGYDIYLRWSSPIQFNPKTGNALAPSGVFQRTQDNDDDSINEEGGDGASAYVSHFSRRSVGFVDWENHKPYRYYQDMDTDLAILHNSQSDPLISKNKTKMLGPFGVFQGSVPNSSPVLSKSVSVASTNGNELRRAMSSRSAASSVKDGGKDTKVTAEAGPSTHSSSGSPLKKKKLNTNLTSDAIPTTGNGGLSPNTEQVPAMGAQDLWLSNELRDDAMLTAAALNGDVHFLDLMSTISTPNSNIFTPVNFNNYNYNTNQNDFLNLVFHRNSNHQGQQHSNANGVPLDLPVGDHHTSMSQQQEQLQVREQSQQNDIQPQQQLHQNQQQRHQHQQQHQQSIQHQQSRQSQNHQHVSLTNDAQYSNYNDYYYNNPYKQNENLEIHLDASSKHNTSNENEPNTDIVEGESSNATTMPTSIMCTVQSLLEPKLGYDLTIPPNSPEENKTNNSNTTTIIPPGLPSTALQVQPLTRYLLNYYVTTVADLMTVIPLTENPWKSIYFPRALMAIGELSALGHTSDAKNALLNALLAVSAFNLQSKFPKNSSPMKYYLNLGIRLRNQASVFVKKLLNSNNDGSIENCVRNEKYKDVLCAVMSMISVDLVWGTMQDTNYYINWCGKVISQKMINKKKLSTKARILHRIFSSLKLIQDSTCLDLENIKRDLEMEYDVNGDKFGKKGGKSSLSDKNDWKDEKNKIDYLVSSGNRTMTPTSTTTGPASIKLRKASPSFLNKKLINTKKNDENFATDALYGLPNSLIMLFSETVRLLRSKIYQSHQGNSMETFKEEVDVVLKNLENWKLDWVLYEGDMKFFSPMHEATYHHIMSFYHALNIYFNKLILEKPGSELQQGVEKTLEHLNAIQILISKDEAVIIPLFWQGFIAGCEAISQELQMGYKKWGADISQYLGSYWGARQIMLEVWRRKRMNEEKDDWVSVIQDWEMNLMLN